MTDIVEELRLLQSGAQWACGATAATLGEAADKIERLRAALLTAEGMLSEMGISSAEKCQMAYDHLRETRAALKEGEG